MVVNSPVLKAIKYLQLIKSQHYHKVWFKFILGSIEKKTAWTGVC